MWYESYVSPSARLILRILPFFSDKSVENDEFLLQKKIIFQVEMDLSFTIQNRDRCNERTGLLENAVGYLMSQNTKCMSNQRAINRLA